LAETGETLSRGLRRILREQIGWVDGREFNYANLRQAWNDIRTEARSTGNVSTTQMLFIGRYAASSQVDMQSVVRAGFGGASWLPLPDAVHAVREDIPFRAGVSYVNARQPWNTALPIAIFS